MVMKGRSILGLMVSLVVVGAGSLPVLARKQYQRSKLTANEVYLDNNCRRNQGLLPEDRFILFYRSQFRTNNQDYWFYAGRYQDGAAIFCISKPNFNEAKPLDRNLKIQFQFIDNIVQVYNVNTAFIVTFREGNGFGVPLTDYRLDLSNPNRPVLAQLSQPSVAASNTQRSVNSNSAQQTGTGRSANSNSGQQIATGRVSTPRQSLPITTSSQELVVSNVGCTSNLQNILGQSALDYCRSAEADSGILFDKFIQTKNRDGSITVEIRLFNRGSADGLIEIYDARGNLVDGKIINGNKPPTGILQSGYRMFVEYPQTWWSRYPLGDSRRDLKEQSFSITIPAGGFVNITKSSNLALWYNTAILAIEVSQLKGDPEFTQQESVKKFLWGFAQEAVLSKDSKTVSNIFKSEPSLQGIFTLDFLDERKVGVVLQRLWEYTLTITRDESDGSLKNPLYEAFQEVGLDTANVGVENAIDRFLLPGLGTFVRSVRQGGNGLNTLARILDYNNAMKSGEKATVTIRSVSTTGAR